MTVKVRKDNVKAVMEAIHRLTSMEVLVGIPREKAERDPPPGKSDEPINNVELGYIHEFGAPEANIPARPFLIPGVVEAQSKLLPRMKKAGSKAMEGSWPEAMAQLDLVGLLAQSAVKQKIEDGPFAPLKPQTIAAREARGHMGTKPLIDRAIMQGSVTYVVAKKGS